MIDNYDSFTYNLVQYLGEVDPDIQVVRNDCFNLDELCDKPPERIVISPGPGRPEDAGHCIELIQRLNGKIPILGVCLGHQAICMAFGGRIISAPQIVHGKVSAVIHEAKGLYKGLDSPLQLTRYHSLVAEWSSLPDCLEVSAKTEDDIIMSVRHKKHPTFGLQYHPESIASTAGKQILKQFLES